MVAVILKTQIDKILILKETAINIIVLDFLDSTLRAFLARMGSKGYKGKRYGILYMGHTM